MSFLQLVLSFDKTIKEIILLWRICQFDRYRNRMRNSNCNINFQLQFFLIFEKDFKLIKFIRFEIIVNRVSNVSLINLKEII